MRRRFWEGLSLLHRSIAVRTIPTGPARRERRLKAGMAAFFLMSPAQALVSFGTESLRRTG
jgi:hypothetical protein